VEFFEDRGLVVWFAVLQYPLNDPAAIRMGSKDVNLASECFDNKLNVLSWHSLDRFLNNMVSILIFHALQDINLEFLNELRLLIR
jgi:hypothetical protein